MEPENPAFTACQEALPVPQGLDPRKFRWNPMSMTFFSPFFLMTKKKSADVFPESMDHHHLYHVFQWELPCWPPFFTSVLFVIWGLSPNFCTGSCYRGKIQGSSGDTGDTPFLNIPYLVANYPRIVVVGSFTPVIDMG